MFSPRSYQNLYWVIISQRILENFANLLKMCWFQYFTAQKNHLRLPLVFFSKGWSFLRKGVKIQIFSLLVNQEDARKVLDMISKRNIQWCWKARSESILIIAMTHALRRLSGNQAVEISWALKRIHSIHISSFIHLSFNQISAKGISQLSSRWRRIKRVDPWGQRRFESSPRWRSLWRILPGKVQITVKMKASVMNLPTNPKRYLIAAII